MSQRDDDRFQAWASEHSLQPCDPQAIAAEVYLHRVDPAQLQWCGLPQDWRRCTARTKAGDRCRNVLAPQGNVRRYGVGWHFHGTDGKSRRWINPDEYEVMLTGLCPLHMTVRFLNVAEDILEPSEP